jgi:hypothetical protein
MNKAGELLKKLGYSDEQITKLTSEDAEVQKTVDVDTLFAETEERLVKKFKEGGGMDSELAKKAKQILVGREKKVIEELKKVGLDITEEEIEALPEKSRTDDVIALAISKLHSTKKPDNEESKKEIDRLNGQLREKLDKIKNLEEVELPKAKTEAQQMIEQTQKESYIDNVFTKEYGGKLKIKDAQALKLFKEELNAKVDVKMENGEPVLYVKGKDVPYYKDATKTPFKTFVDEVIAEMDIVAKQDPAQRKKDIPEPGGKTEISTPGLNRAQQRIAEKEAAQKK